jgi:hypothetical protein
MREVNVQEVGLDRTPKFQSAVDWKTDPRGTLEEVDRILKNLGLEVVLIDWGDDSVGFGIVERGVEL